LIQRIITNYTPKGKKEPAEIIKQTSGYVRQKQVNKGHNSLIAK
jgi:hypothetical protein